MKKYSKEKIENKNNHYREQRINPTGKFTEFMVRTYFIINKLCLDSENKKCYTSQISKWKLVEYLYEGVYDNNKSNHSTCICEECIKELVQMKYIRYVKNEDENRWCMEIIRPLEFLLDGEEEFYRDKYKNLYIE